MKVAIIENDHFQYGLTMSSIFEEHERIFIVTELIKSRMFNYQPELCKGTFYIMDGIEGCDQFVIDICTKEKVELLLLGPVFKGFEAVLRFTKELKCTKVLTIHNMNFWLNSRYRTPEAYKLRKIKQEIVKNFEFAPCEKKI